MNTLTTTSILSRFTFGLLLASVANATAPKVSYDAGKYTIDPMHSSVTFEVPHLVISTVEGKFTSFSGNLEMDKAIEKSKVDVSIETKSIDTGVGKRDDHLKSPDFFEVAKFPVMSFKSSSVKGTPEDFVIQGDLTIKGITKKVNLKSKYLGSVVDGYGNKKAAFIATTEISRKEFGLTWNSMVEAGPVVGDAISIKLKIQAAKNK